MRFRNCRMSNCCDFGNEFELFRLPRRPLLPTILYKTIRTGLRQQWNHFCEFVPIQNCAMRSGSERRSATSRLSGSVLCNGDALCKGTARAPVRLWWRHALGCVRFRFYSMHISAKTRSQFDHGLQRHLLPRKSMSNSASTIVRQRRAHPWQYVQIRKHQMRSRSYECHPIGCGISRWMLHTTMHKRIFARLRSTWPIVPEPVLLRNRFLRTENAFARNVAGDSLSTKSEKQKRKNRKFRQKR